MNRQLFQKRPGCHEFKLLKQIPNLVQGVFTRHGGVSKPPYATLNVVWNNGDSKEAVHENLRRVKRTLGLEHLTASMQTHGDVVQVADETKLKELHNGLPVALLPPGDALVTQLRGVGLLIKIADCQAVFLVDPVQQVIANVHCGWRGSVNGLLLKVVRVLQNQYGSRAEDLYAGISPSLGPCCAEFRDYRQELPPVFQQFQVRPRYFDFWAISRWQLREAGLPADHIEVAGRCTVCGSRDFFSYRGEGTTGRMAAVIAWK